ncbi:MAG: protein kinase, partial [Pirellulales bacterium]|nr:protein kinase [Pirellulales bacterium]
MINKACADQLDEAIDFFEENWSPRSRGQIRSLLKKFDLGEDYSALTELIRIDIELRYRRDVPIKLEDYFNEFEVLLKQPTCVAQIAFEDYRSRTKHGLPVCFSRWRELPGVSNQAWYQELTYADKVLSPYSLPLKNGHASARQGFSEELESSLRAIGFRLIDQLGEGAFSHVYLATQDDLADRDVVLKVVQRTLAEPQKMARLQHTNIVPIYSFHRVQARSVICMPYAGGVTMDSFLDAQALGGTERTGQSLVTTVLNQVNDTVVASDSQPLPASPMSDQAEPLAE